MTTSERTGSRSEEPDGPSPAPVTVPSSDDVVEEPAIGLAALAKARDERARSRRPSSRTTEVIDPPAGAPGPSAGAPGSAAASTPSATSATSATAAPAPTRAERRAASKAERERAPSRPKRRRGAARRKAPESKWWTVAFPIVLILLIIAIPVLMYAGSRIVLDSNDGTLVATNTDPTKPGWEAITPPTPTMMLVQVDDSGSPTGITVLSQAGPNAGGVIFVPVTSVLSVPGYGSEPLNKAFDDLGMDGLRQGVQNLLGVGTSDLQVIDDGQWADLLSAVGPLQFTNSETVTVPGVGVFPKGPLTLQPQQVGAYLATPVVNSIDTNRLLRHDAFWHALLAKLAATPVTLPGDPDKGLSHYLPELATSQVDIQQIPVTQVRLPGSNDALFSPVPDQLSALIAKLIPFPTEAALGTRPKVRILDGTGKLSHGVGAAPALVRGGAQITGVGNAANFDYTQTQLIYSDDAQKDATDKLAAALGVGTAVKSAQLNADVDVTVILGTDYLSKPASSDDTVITTPPTNIGTVTVTIPNGGGG